MVPRQFSLAFLMVFVTLCCFLAAAVHWLGAQVVGWLLATAVGGAVVIVLWSAVYFAAPEATKYGTVVGLLGVMLLSILSLWLHQAREQARRNSSIDALRRFSEQTLERSDFERALPSNGRVNVAAQQS
jgi:hypothetical protein